VSEYEKLMERFGALRAEWMTLAQDLSGAVYSEGWKLRKSGRLWLTVRRASDGTTVADLWEDEQGQLWVVYGPAERVAVETGAEAAAELAGRL